MKISLEEAAKKLSRGEVVAIPTETVYGLAACYNQEEAIQKIYQLKNRPANNPLIMHISSLDDLNTFTRELPPSTKSLGETFWPGPLTLVIPIDPKTVPEKVRAHLHTQAFRIPAHPLTRALLKKTGPLVAPSANLSGKPSSVTHAHVETDFGNDFPVLDGGECQKGVESTILVFQEGKWYLGRLGALSAHLFQPILGYVPEELIGKKPLCPGQMYRHYAPKAHLHLGGDFSSAENILGFSDRKYPKHARLFSLGKSSDPEEVLHHLYSVLRKLDEEKIKSATLDIDVPKEGLWLTFLERIKKASGN